MRIKESLIAVVSLMVACVYALDAYRTFSSAGFVLPVFAKRLVCAGGFYLLIARPPSESRVAILRMAPLPGSG
jgi:hypothetical protein